MTSQWEPAPEPRGGNGHRATLGFLLAALLIVAAAVAGAVTAIGATTSASGTGSGGAPATAARSDSPTESPSQSQSPTRTPSRGTPPPSPDRDNATVTVVATGTAVTYVGPCTGSATVSFQVLLTASRPTDQVSLTWLSDLDPGAGGQVVSIDGSLHRTVGHTEAGATVSHSGWLQALASVGGGARVVSNRVPYSITCTTPRLDLTPDTIRPFVPLTATASGFQPHEIVDFSYRGGTPVISGPLDSRPVEADGTWRFDTMDAFPVGVYTITATGETSHATAVRTLTVLPAPHLELSAVAIRSGDLVRFTLTNFPADETVRLGDGGGSVPVTIGADGSGSFSSAEFLSAGDHDFSAVDGSGLTSNTVRLSVRP